jgi:hypothetical protein
VCTNAIGEGPNGRCSQNLKSESKLKLIRKGDEKGDKKT